ncbi:hypothetical protein K1W69_19335 [Hoeflea sp. WL0058]|uniref:Uncharacterized protein n=1 Tax=Flavimaribacter sediminis TaxID=2865987 RepID=A0AAE2ZNB8_9HYPH|nr:hypothetical protein [Flavimaribacter sediminis]MBW8639356.1 hypothetical protein [Flavimaribacter sediminis]
MNELIFSRIAALSRALLASFSIKRLRFARLEAKLLKNCEEAMSGSGLQWDIAPHLVFADHRRNMFSALLVRFAGEYGPGSHGRPDARLIEAVLLMGVALTGTQAAILDFRQMEYVWGDDMSAFLRIYRFYPFEVPVVLIVSDLNSYALGTLAQALGYDPNEIFFQDMESAVQGLRALVERTDSKTPGKT